MQRIFFLSLFASAVFSFGATKDIDLKRDVQAARAVVLGKVERTASYYGTDGEIYTDVTLRVEARLKSGGSGADSITFTTPGGEVGDVGVLFTAAPRFSEGEPVMVFLEDAIAGSPGNQPLRGTAKYEMNLEQIPDLNLSPLELLLEVGRVMSEDNDRPAPREWQKSADFLAKHYEAAKSAPTAAAVVCYKPMGPKWAAKAATFKLDTTLPDGFGPVVKEAAGSWTGAGSGFRFSFDAASTNVVNYAAIATAGVLASTRVSYQPSTNTIVGFTLTFNTNYTWTTAGEAGKFDVQNVGTHEMGHALGLDHPSDASCSEQTMWASAGAGETKKRTLEAGDKDGEVSLYGSSTTTPPTTPPPTVVVPSFTYVYLYSRPVVNKAFNLAVLGKDFDPKTLQFVFKGPGCPALGCVVDTAALQVSATQAIGAFTATAAGDFSLNLRNGATGALSPVTAKFSIR